ncbi:MAG TPA: KpsF/GutQ family sugar-phosphate isomerase [Elusimicrobiota bacterium]|nr:KpsF/GutQ family sugar-phosphate isomerase [Elusimicrobiota bacterium]
MKKNGSDASLRASLRRVVALEADALRLLHEAIDGRFVRAARLMARCTGNIIVTGMGKSGIIARKIAATLSSTGTPAIYLDPADALHGDLGMVRRRDLALAIGKSGESAELNAVLPALKRLGVRVIALTANPTSTLGRFADLVLAIPVEREACPLNLAPTCSTTAALAAGDALAVALMDLRRFRREHFAMLHPGGQLGRRLTLRVDDVMRAGRDNPVVRLDVDATRMLLEITRKRAGAASVVDARGKLVGLVTDFDIRRAVSAHGDLRRVSVREVMNPRPITARSGSLAAEAAQLMSERRNPLNVLPVVDRARRPVGMLQIHDLRAQGL